MSDKTILLTMRGCHGCRQVKEELSDALAKGEVEEIPIESARGRLIAQELHLDAVPECVEEKDGKFSKCDLDALMRRYAKSDEPPQEE